MKKPEGKADNASELVGEFVRIHLRGRTWYANYQHEGRQQRVSLATASKKEARVRAMRIENNLLAGQASTPRVGPPLSEVVEEYMTFLTTEGRAHKTLVKYRGAFKNLLELADRRRVRRIDEVTMALIDTFRRERKQAGVADKTIYTETVIVRQLINFALTRDHLAVDPLKSLRLKKPKPTPQPCWTLEEVDRILAASKEPLQSILRLLAETGMRVGELQHLAWADVDLERGVLHIRPKEGWKPKTGDRRAVPISQAARTVLEQLPRRGR